MNDLLRSRRFWFAAGDLVASTALYFGAKYAGAGFGADVQWLILAVQPIFAIVIIAYTVNDQTALRLAHEAEMEREQRAHELALAQARTLELRELRTALGK